MIASISGTIQRIEANSLIISVGGVGVRVFVPKTVLEDAGGPGRRLMLHTHLQVREDDLSLFGFEQEEDLQLFEVLLGVNGVGPKVALAILGTLSPELLKSAILREESAVLQRVPGIGKKTAERIMFQLRDKLDLHEPSAALQLVTDIDADVIDVLTSLGFSIVEAQAALQHIPRDVQGMDERVQLALQHLDQYSS
jgi:Holliday junction DNA helicase RuvA